MNITGMECPQCGHWADTISPIHPKPGVCLVASNGKLEVAVDVITMCLVKEPEISGSRMLNLVKLAMAVNKEIIANPKQGESINKQIESVLTSADTQESQRNRSPFAELVDFKEAIKALFDDMNKNPQAIEHMCPILFEEAEEALKSAQNWILSELFEATRYKP